MLLTLFTLAGSFTPLALSQDFSVPLNWRKPTVNRSRDERIAVAQSVAHSVTYNETSGYVPKFKEPVQSAHWHCSLALHDWITANNSNHASVKDHLMTVQATVSEQWQSENAPLTWGLASYHAYRAYNDSSFLDIAQTFWNQGNTYFISPEEAATGLHPTRNISFRSQCNGSTTAGGVFWQPNPPSNGIVTANAAGSYFALSAHLYEATKNQTYATSADLSADFVRSHLYDPDVGVIQGRITIGPGDCIPPTGGVSSYNSGIMIEALSVYANVTGNDTLVNFLHRLIASTVKYHWSDDQGILYEDTDKTDPSTVTIAWGYKGIFIRGLYEAWTRSPPDSDVAKMIQSFISVQYNALQDLAKLSAGNYYSPVWVGPPPQSPLPWGQLGAIDVLNSAINLPVLDTPSSSDSERGARGKNKLIAEVVGPIGGVILILLVAFFVTYVRRRRNLRASASSPVSILPLEEVYTPRPFLVVQGSSIPSTRSPNIEHEELPPVYSDRPSTGSGSPFPPPYPDPSHEIVVETVMSNRRRKLIEAFHGHMPR